MDSAPPPVRTLRLLSANIQAGASTRRYSDYATRSWSHVLPAGRKRDALDAIADVLGAHDIVGLNESDPGSLRSGFTNQTHYLAERAGFAYWSHQPNRRVGRVASSANGLLSRFAPREVFDHPLPGRVAGRGVLVARYGSGRDALLVAVAHLSLGTVSRRQQIAYLTELLADHPHAVLMGDFNCAPDRPEMQPLFAHTRLQPPPRVLPTFPSWKPARAIDHVLLGDGLACLRRDVLPAARSDHLALSVEIRVPAVAWPGP